MSRRELVECIMGRKVQLSLRAFEKPICMFVPRTDTGALAE
ncbi:uncharacterized protein METZ01_LOCUS351864 [marine metagenome]|uniref:Uncharacterized protein n=1 Tax=marine metagenome TaxID=408172 RepID=A0A382RNL1_9ZZZZ